MGQIPRQNKQVQDGSVDVVWRDCDIKMERLSYGNI